MRWVFFALISLVFSSICAVNLFGADYNNGKFSVRIKPDVVGIVISALIGSSYGALLTCLIF